MTVSVIMNCYNSAEFLKEAIDSVYAQTFQDWEIIFWDNASTDKSPEIAKSYGEKLRYFRGDSTVSLGKARNLAIEQAKGEYIAFLDCDDLWITEKLERQVSILKSHPGTDLLYANYYILKGNHLAVALRRREPEGRIFGDNLSKFTVGILTVLIRRKALFSLDSLFDENLNLAEEFDLFMRLLYNSEAIYQAQPVAVYRIHPGMCSIKSRDKWRDEITYCIDKFARLYPDFEKNYQPELNRRRLDLEYLSAKILMKEGDLWSARRQIAPIKLKGAKYFFLYLFSYLPVSFWNFVSLYLIRKPI